MRKWWSSTLNLAPQTLAAPHPPMQHTDRHHGLSATTPPMADVNVPLSLKLTGYPTATRNVSEAIWPSTYVWYRLCPLEAVLLIDGTDLTCTFAVNNTSGWDDTNSVPDFNGVGTEIPNGWSTTPPLTFPRTGVYVPYYSTSSATTLATSPEDTLWQNSTTWVTVNGMFCGAFEAASDFCCIDRGNLRSMVVALRFAIVLC